MEEKRSFWKKFGVALAIVAFILAAFAIDGLLNILSGVPIIGLVARFIRYLRNTVY